MFKESLESMYLRTDKLYYNYLGISRKENPKWLGWKIINAYKEKGVHITEINDKTLDVLVQNFYYTIYLTELEKKL